MLFFELAQKEFGYLNLNTAAKRWFFRNGISTTEANPLLDPIVCNQMVEELHEELGLSYSFGGWLEDRSALWRGSYLDQKEAYLHLGVDFNVPAGTMVAAEQEAEVLRIDCDVPEEGGWGTRVILKPKEGTEVLLYAHLDADVSCHVGDRLKVGDEFAKVGTAPFNGGWFSHLHVQCVDETFFQESLKNNLKDLDGYGSINDLPKVSRLFKDPLRHVWK
jgi:murein DD-endopeptidase MepM/ murein hydrolase activator NlpD